MHSGEPDDVFGSGDRVAIHDVIMPKIGMYTDDVRLVEWLEAEGAEVRAGDLIFTLETNKTTSDVEADVGGFLHRIVAQDSLVPIGVIVGAIAETRAEYDELENTTQPTKSLRAVKTTSSKAPAEQIRPPAGSQTRAGPLSGGPMLVSPRARALISQLQLPDDLVDAIPATGPGGRLTDRDVRAFVEAKPPVDLAASGPTNGPAVAKRIPLRGRRGLIARRMMESLQGAAQLTSTLEIEVGSLVSWRNQRDPRPSVAAIFISIVAHALRAHPILNSSVAEDAIEVFADIHVGFAVSTQDGIVVPVVRHADALAFRQLEDKVASLTKRAREFDLTVDELQGGTFTVSNTGGARVDITTAILNPPQAAILWLGQIRDRPTVVEGALAVRPTVHACLTYDHRVIDGVPAAEFLAEIESRAHIFPEVVDRQ